METFLFSALALGLGLALGYFIAASSKNAVTKELRGQIESLQNKNLAETERREGELKEEGEIKALITPIASVMNQISSRVEAMEQSRSREVQEMKTEFQKTAEGQARLSAATTALANTLGNNQKRGAWGEMHLLRLLEELGMQEDVDYQKQTKTVNEAGEPIKPDVIVRMTEGKSLAIDSKVPLSYFEQASRIELEAGEQGEAERKALLQKHVAAVRKHVDDISKKVYHSGLEASPEFTLLYIPTETVYASTLELDPNLLDFAMGKHVVLVSPPSLYATLKAIMYSWQQNAQEDFIKDILDLGQTMFKNLLVLAEHIEEMGKGIKKSVSSYNALIGSLQTNFLKSVSKLNDENSKMLSSQKVLPNIESIEDPLKEITKSELKEPPQELE